MTSLYGGKPGTSFVIKGHFNYISATDDTYQVAYNELIAGGATEDEAAAQLKPLTMTECFSDAEYKDIWYNEYCIIDTLNKSDSDNGKVFRRTLKGAGDTPEQGSVAEYVGQIVGPAGPPPMIEIGSLESTENKFDYIGETRGVTNRDYIKFYNEQGQEKNEYTNGDNLYRFDNSIDNAIQFIPGNTIDDTDSGYIESPHSNWFQFIDGSSNTDEPVQIYIGFEIPYLYTDFETGQALNYTEDPTCSLAVNAPFYNTYTINIPRGITGANIRDIRRVIVDDEEIYQFSNIEYIAATDTYQLRPTVQPMTGLTNKDVYLSTFYWNDAEGTEHTIDNLYIGYVKDVRNIELQSNGNLVVTYSDDTTVTSGTIS